jgi:hypothetical protein
MSDENSRRRRASRRLPFRSPSLNLSPGGIHRGPGSSGVSRAKAVALMSDTDHEIVHLLSEHRVITTQQIATLLGVPERTVRYRMERLESLQLAGRSEPYADRGKAPHHWWPTRTADAYARGEPIPSSGEREGPNPSFLKHAASLTGIFIGLCRLAESMSLSLSFRREAEGKESFSYEGRETAIVPDASIVLTGESHYEAFIELDMGTASLTKLARKLGLYLAYAQRGVWIERHQFLPALLFITTTERRAESILRAFQAKSQKEHPSWANPFEIQSYTFGICAEARRPERAFSDPVWTGGGGVDGISLINLISEPAQRKTEREAELRAQEEQLEAERSRFRGDPEARRRQIQEEQYAVESHDRNLRLGHISDEKADLLRRLLNSTGPMSPEEKRAWWFFERRIDPDREPFAVTSREVSPDEDEALEELRDYYIEQQKAKLASLNAQYPHLPVLVRGIKLLASGELLGWTEEARLNEALRNDLAKAKKHHGRMLDYLIWRRDEMRTRKSNLGRMQKLVAKDEEISTLIDQHLLRYCPDCETIAIPSTSLNDYGRAPDRCEFCGGDDLERLEQTVRAGLVEPDGEGFWRVCHPSLPQWASSYLWKEPS